MIDVDIKRWNDENGFFLDYEDIEVFIRVM